MNEQDNQKRYIGTSEVIAITGVSSDVLRQMEKAGKFPARKKLSARTVRWWLPDVLAWVKNPEGWTSQSAA